MFFQSQGVHAALSPVEQAELPCRGDTTDPPLTQTAPESQMVEQVKQKLAVEEHLVVEESLHDCWNDSDFKWQLKNSITVS